jgi:hypothetical protein
MSTFDKSTLVIEVSEIINAKVSNTAGYYEAVLIVGDKIYSTYKVISMDIVRDYATAFADKVIIQVSMPGGTFFHDILPFKQDLKLMLTKSTYTTMKGLETETPISNQIFRATLLQTESPTTAGSENAAKVSRETLNLMDIRTVSFQLQDIVMEQLRMISYGTIYRECNVTDVLKGIFSSTDKMVKVDVENTIKGVTMIEADNHEVQDHIIIPHETKLIDIPDLLQNERCGVYSAGLGFYLQNKMWYIWPLYNLKRSNTSERTLTVILIPSNKMPGVENTYRVTSKQLIIVVTGGAKHSDDSESKLLNEGNGIRVPDSRKLLEGFGSVKGNKVVADRGANGSQFIGVPRSSNLNHVPTGKMTHNIYNETSKLASRAGSQMMANWQNSDPDLLIPTMAVTVIYERDGLPVLLDACLIGAHSYVSAPESSIKSKQHITTTMLSLFVDKDLPEYKDYAEEGKVNQYNV